MTDAPKTCAECRCWERVEADLGVCRARSPHVIAPTNAGQWGPNVAYVSVFPRTRPEDWCWEWREKPGPIQETFADRAARQGLPARQWPITQAEWDRIVAEAGPEPKRPWWVRLWTG